MNEEEIIYMGTLSAVANKNMILTLFQNMSVIILLAYFLTRCTFFNDVLNHKLTKKNKLYLIVFFGAFSIYGTLSGIKIFGALANIRDLGPTIAGLLGGPLVGFGAGLVGGLHRLTGGGITCYACSFSTVLAGLIGGMVHLILKGKFPNVPTAVGLSALIEIIHFGIALAISKPYEDALRIVKAVWFPMVFANAFGMGVFSFMILNLIKERDTESIKEMIESELRVAREIQLSIVPKIFPPFPEIKEFDLYAIINPAKEVGGDLYDFFMIDSEHLCFTIGDVSGKGVPASLFMAVTKTLIKAKTYPGMHPDEILYAVNNEICSENDTMMFITEFLGILEVKTGRIEFSNGGHNPPYIIRKSGEVVQLNKPLGRALGITEDYKYDRNSAEINSGDMLVMYTDGVTEAMNTKSEIFTEKRLEAFLPELSKMTPKEATERIVQEISKFAHGAVQSDDITVVILKKN